MKEQPIRGASSGGSDAWTWILLAGILLLSGVVGLGALAMASFNQQSQMATGSQTAPAAR